MTQLMKRLKGAESFIVPREHYYSEDCWYSCPKSEEGCCDDRQGDECNCGAEEHNKRVAEYWSKYD